MFAMLTTAQLMIKTKKRWLLPLCSDRLSCDAEVADIMLPLEDGGGVTEDGRILFFFAIVYLSARALSLATHIKPLPLPII